MSHAMKISRGALIVVEGCDRSGKSTQCTRLVEELNKNNIQAKRIVFPDRSTKVGQLIDSYLKGNQDLPDQVIHLLFAANRWELEPKMRELINSGYTVICDRYSYSGVAYSAAKKNEKMDLEWCKGPEEGLPKPDKIFYLKLKEEIIKQRLTTSSERYEKLEFQMNVNDAFSKLMDNSWKIIDADTTVDNLTKTLLKEVKDVIDETRNKPLSYLWKKD